MTDTQSPVEANEFAPQVWGSEDGVGQLHAVTCPSGQRAQILRPGVAGLMEADILHNLDGLTAMVEKHVNKARGKKPSDRKRKGSKPSDDIDVDGLMKDTEALKDIMTVVNQAMVAFIVQPKVHPDPEDISDREDGKIYTAMIDLNDRLFLFNYMVGGSKDLTSFREGLAEAVGSLEAESELQHEAE